MNAAKASQHFREIFGRSQLAGEMHRCPSVAIHSLDPPAVVQNVSAGRPKFEISEEVLVSKFVHFLLKLNLV